MGLYRKSRELIQRLNKAEVAYLYKKFKTSNRTKYQHFLFLLKEIKKNPQLPEEKLKEKFHKKFPVKISFNKIKYEFYEETLRIASEYLCNFSSSQETEPLKIKLLLQKNLLEDARKRTYKFLEKQKQYENYQYVLVALDCLLKILDKEIVQNPEEYDFFYDTYREALEFLTLRQKYRKFLTTMYSRRGEELETFKQKFDKLFPNPPPFESLKMLHFEFLSYYYWRTGKFVQCAREQEKIINIFLKNPDFIEQTPNYFAVCINNYAFNLSFIKEWDKAFNAAAILKEKMNTFKNGEPFLSFVQKYLMTQTYLLYKSRNLPKIQQELPELEAIFRQYHTHFPDPMLARIHLHFAMIYFLQKETLKALFWTEKTANLSPKLIGKENHLIVLFLKLILNLEAENYLVLPYLLRNLYRQLYKYKGKNAIHPAEEFLLKLIRKFLKKRKTRNDIRNFLQQLEENPLIYEYWSNVFDLKTWLKEKLSSLQNF